MRSKLSKFILVMFALALIFALASCTGGGTGVVDDVPTVSSIAVDTSTIPTSVFAGELDVTQIRLIVTYSDDTKEMVSVTFAMVALESRTKLDTPGTKTIKLVYKSCEARFQIVLLNKDKNQYTLRVYNGVPTAIDNVTLDEDIVLDGEYYEALYDEGTIVTLEWIAVSGYFFDYWTDNDKKIDTQSITKVTMNANHNYKAYSEAVINTVSFVTNCDTGVGVRRTNYLNQADIPTLKKEGYVFDGWTTTVTLGDNAIDNTQATKITFPYNVSVETTLYGLWRLLGIGYESNPSISPSGVTGYKILSYSKNDKEVIIPDKYNNYPVISIGENAFADANMMRKLTIPASVEVIEEGSFKNCSQLSEILISGSSRTYSSTNGILFNYDGTELIAYPSNKISAIYTIGVGVEIIKAYALYNSLIGGIVLPNTIRNIGNNAFNSVHTDYVDFSSVNPNALNFTLGTDLFNANIRTICVDASYRSIYMGYSQMSGFASRIGTDINELSIIETNAEKSLLYREIYNENSRLPATTSEIIGAIRTLTTLRVPVNLHYSVSSIGVEAFNDCILLSNVEIPMSSLLERIQERAFDDTIWVRSLRKSSIIANGILYKYLGFGKEYVLDNNIKEIAEGAFKNNKTLQKLNLETNSDLAHIGAYAFYGCTAFTGDTTTGNGITFKEKLINIGSFAFASTIISKFNLAEGSKLVNVGEGAFQNCYYLLNATFAATTEEIASNAFDNCFSLTSFYVQSTDDSKFITFDGVLYKYDKRLDAINKPSILYLYPAGRMATEFNINSPTGVENLTVSQISDNAFNFSNIAALYVPSTVTNINAHAINIPGLIYVKFQVMNGTMTYYGMFGEYEPEYILVVDTTAIDSSINILNYFDSNTALQNEKYKEQAIIDVLSFYNDGTNPDNSMIYALREGSLRLARTARNLQNITIPSVQIEGNSVTKIGEFAFYGYYLNCVRLGGNESIFAANAFSKAVKMFKIYTVQGAGVPDIEDNTFSNLFDNGLMIYVSYSGNTKESYRVNWSLSSDRYLIDLDTELPIATFAGIEIGIIPDINGEITSLTVPKPTRAGYQFAGWLDDKSNIIDVTSRYIIPYNITLTCVWEPKVYIINFSIESNASISQSTTTVTYEAMYTFPVPVYANMVLKNWRTASGVEYASSGLWAYALTADSITLYPVWEDKVYVLEYDTTDVDVIVVGTQTEVFVNSLYQLPVPQKEGYDFLGWYLERNSQNEPIYITNKLGESFLRWSLSSSDTFTVYPAWENKIISVKLYLQYTDDNNFVLYTTKEVTFGMPFNFAFENDYIDSLWHKKDIFCGWYDTYDYINNSGIGVRYCDEDGLGLFNWNVGVACSLYAQWPMEISDGNALVAMSGIELSKSFVLTNNITINRPIGDKDNPYSGLFNGNGFTVTLNYTVSVLDNSNFDGYVGMFAINNGTIKNVKLISNINIECNGEKAGSPIYIGGLVGYNNGKVYSTATTGYDVVSNIIVSFHSVNFTNVNIGGLIGYNTGNVVKLGLDVTLKVIVDGITYEGSGYNIGNTIGTMNGGVLDGTNRSSVYYFTSDTDGFKNVVCGKIISGTIIAFAPSATKKV